MRRQMWFCSPATSAMPRVMTMRDRLTHSCRHSRRSSRTYLGCQSLAITSSTKGQIFPAISTLPGKNGDPSQANTTGVAT